MHPQTRKTERGFAIYEEFVDTYGQEVRVQESSNVEPAVWIFCLKDGKSAIARPVGTEDPQAYSPHLSPEQARKVAAALVRFADDTERASRPEDKP